MVGLLCMRTARCRPNTKEGKMSCRIKLRRALGLVSVVAALASATAMASSTPQGLKADGLRLQGLAQRYEWLQSRPAASFYTAQALRADALRWQAMARAYAQPKGTTISSSGSFDWADAGIGAASGFALALCIAIVIAWARRTRETKLAV
jgi:hypothetical protein